MLVQDKLLLRIGQVHRLHAARYAKPEISRYSSTEKGAGHETQGIRQACQYCRSGCPFFGKQQDLGKGLCSDADGPTEGYQKNILVLFVDQQRYDCLGGYGNETAKTPNLDRLASQGVRFTNAYTPAPVCSPARTSFQTGLWPHNHRLLFNTGESRDKGGRDDLAPDVRFSARP